MLTIAPTNNPNTIGGLTDYMNSGVHMESFPPTVAEMSYEATSTNAEKIAFVEKLIRTRRITLKEGLLLLSEKVIIKTQSIQAPQPYFTPGTGGNPYNPVYTYGSTGLTMSSTGSPQPRSPILSGRTYSIGEFDTRLPGDDRDPIDDPGARIRAMEAIDRPMSVVNTGAL